MIQVFHPANYAPIPGPSEFDSLNEAGHALEYAKASDVPEALRLLDGIYVAIIDVPGELAPAAPAPKPARKVRKAA